MSRELKTGGLYKHWKKGAPYRALGLVRHSETLEEFVLYETLYENPRGKLWVRPKTMFLDDVVVDGRPVPRFAEVTDAQTDAN